MDLGNVKMYPTLKCRNSVNPSICIHFSPWWVAQAISNCTWPLRITIETDKDLCLICPLLVPILFKNTLLITLISFFFCLCSERKHAQRHSAITNYLVVDSGIAFVLFTVTGAARLCRAACHWVVQPWQRTSLLGSSTVLCTKIQELSVWAGNKQTVLESLNDIITAQFFDFIQSG